jgi:hypothetical protein
MILAGARQSGDASTALAAAAEARAVAETSRKLLTRTAEPKTNAKRPDEVPEIEIYYEQEGERVAQ